MTIGRFVRAVPGPMPNDAAHWQALARVTRRRIADRFVEVLGRLTSRAEDAAARWAFLRQLEDLCALPPDLRAELLSSPAACALAALLEGHLTLAAGTSAPPLVVRAFEAAAPRAEERARYLLEQLAALADEGRRLAAGPDGEVRPWWGRDLLEAMVPSLAADGPERWPAALRDGYDVLERYSNGLAQAGRLALRLILPWPAPSREFRPHHIVEQQYRSGSVGFLPGVCWIACGHDPYWMAEALVHEVCHQVLHVFEQHDLLVADEVGVAHSPWQPMPRPYRGILHGFFAFGHALDFVRFMAGEAPPARREYARRRAALLVAQLRLARGELARGLTPAGHRLVEELANALDLGERVPDFVSEIVAARRDAQRPDAANASSAVAILEWVDRNIAATSVCPYATPGIDHGGVRVITLPGARLADVLFELARAVRELVSPRPPGPYDCLIIALPDLAPGETAALDAIAPGEIISLGADAPISPRVELKTRVFDPGDPSSHGPPVPLWVLRARMPHEA